MRCDRVRRQLNALIDDALDDSLAARIAGHLARCPACAAEVAAIRRLGAAAASYCRDAAAPATLRARLTAALWASSDDLCGNAAVPDFERIDELLARLHNQRQQPGEEPERKNEE